VLFLSLDCLSFSVSQFTIGKITTKKPQRNQQEEMNKQKTKQADKQTKIPGSGTIEFQS
jgi:hypothetical protein